MSRELFNGTLNNRRGTSLKYYDSRGYLKGVPSNNPRITYHPTTHENLGVLIEEGKTRLLEDNDDFSDSDWTKFEGATVSSRVFDDLGTGLDSWNIVDNDSGQAGRVIQQVTIADDSNTFSSLVFVKRTTGATVFPAILLELLNGSPIVSIRKVVNTNTGEFTDNVDPADAGTTTATIREDLSTEDYIAVQLTAQNNSSGNTLLSFSMYAAVSSGSDFSNSYVGTHRFCAPQAEASTFSSYPVTTSNAPLSVNGDFFYSSINPNDYADGWTFLIDFYYPGSNEGFIVSYRDSRDINQRVFLRAFSNDTYDFGVVKDAAVYPISLGSLTRNQRYKIAVRIQENDLKVFTNGSEAGSQSSAVLPDSLNMRGLGCDPYTWDNEDIQDMVCRAFQEWPTGLTDAELAAITTL